MNRLFKLLTLLALLATQLDSSAFGESPFADLLVHVGMWKGSDVLDKNYYADKEVQSVFTKNQSLRKAMPQELPNEFNDIINNIHDYVEANNTPADEQENGISNTDLSRRIVRASLCFGTDPKMIAAKIRMESMFRRKSRSATGAVGFTQMTSSGIEEVNDQLGNRGAANAPESNAVYLRKAIRCYLGKDMPMMWEMGVIKKGQTLSGAKLAAAKKWLVADANRDLIYGQILLKINLAVSNGGPKDSMLQIYSKAFVRYNGDMHMVNGQRMKNVYARKVLNLYQNISFDPTSVLNFQAVPEETPDREILPGIGEEPTIIEV